MTGNTVQHPNRKIELLNGTILETFPTTGDKSTISDEQTLKLFLDNAFMFLENKERIMSDSRMFLCPIPSRSGLAYLGDKAFRNPTLGIFVEWWSDSSLAVQRAPDGDEWLVYHIAGSPLSGCNRCGCVNREGKIKRETITPFNNLARSFIKINTRYTHAKEDSLTYTIEEVLEQLKQQ